MEEKRRGLWSDDPEERRAIARKGAAASRQSSRRHIPTSKEARKGGLMSGKKHTKDHLRKIASKGGRQRAINMGHKLSEKSQKLIDLENQIFPE